jgi:glyoxylase-like metal-dependent hydrolase (beta-lactamase superfamily II)
MLGLPIELDLAMTALPAIKRFDSNTGVRIYRIPVDFLPDLSGRVHLLLGAGPPTLVDTGSGRPEPMRQILAGIDTVRTEFGEPVRVSDVRRIIITHAHLDHFGGLAQLLSYTRAEVVTHPFSRRFLEAYEERAVVTNQRMDAFLRAAGTPPQRRGELVYSLGYHPQRVPSVPVDRVMDDGDELDGLRFHHTPGHDAGHVCIQAGELLLAGDHILARTVSQQWPESTGPYTGLGHYLESLQKIRRVQGLSLALPGHEPPIPNLVQRIDEIRASHLRRLDRLLGILADSPQGLSIDEAAARMYTQQKGFVALLAVTDVGSRIEYLDQRGQLSIANLDEVDGVAEPVYRYRPK